MPKQYRYESNSKIDGHLAVLKLGQILGYDDTIGNAAKRIFNIVAGYASPQGECWPSVKQIAKSLGMSRAGVSKQIDILIEHGYLTKKARYNGDTKGRKTNIYLFNIELAQKYYKTPDIFSKKNVTLIVTYLVTLLSYRGMAPLGFDESVTFESDIKRTKKKTSLKKQNKNLLKKAVVRANGWERDNERREKLGISKDQDKELQNSYEELKKIIGPHKVVSFNIQANKALKSEVPAEKINELISIYRAEIDRQKKQQS